MLKLSNFNSIANFLVIDIVLKLEEDEYIVLSSLLKINDLDDRNEIYSIFKVYIHCREI